MSIGQILENLKSFSVEEALLWRAEAKPGQQKRVSDIVRSFCDNQENIKFCSHLLVLNQYKDIGEFFLANLILKPSTLSWDEKEMVARHPALSSNFLREKKMKLGVKEEEILYHHERWDGQGHFGLKGEDIPFTCRVLAPIDVYVALTSDRPYRRAYPYDQALKEIRGQAGKAFDLHLMEEVIKAIQSPAPYCEKLACQK